MIQLKWKVIEIKGSNNNNLHWKINKNTNYDELIFPHNSLQLDILKINVHHCAQLYIGIRY